MVDNTAPIVTIMPVTTDDPTPTLRGTVDDGEATLQLFVDGQSEVPVNNGDGTWELSGLSLDALSANTYDVEIVATDEAGNNGADDTIDEVIIYSEGSTGANRITSNPGPPFIVAGDTLRLTAPNGANYQWLRNREPLNDDFPRVSGVDERVLVFNPVVEDDSGEYTVIYNDGTKALVVSESFTLNVLSPSSLPAIHRMGLAVLVALLAVFGGHTYGAKTRPETGERVAGLWSSEKSQPTKRQRGYEQKRTGDMKRMRDLFQTLTQFVRGAKTYLRRFDCESDDDVR